jgi:hypothetical protein
MVKNLAPENAVKLEYGPETAECEEAIMDIFIFLHPSNY